jgi:putative ABC transport system permease protein
MNWLSQIASITRFGLLSIPQRRGAVAATVFGIAGVVAVLVGVLSMAVGFRQAMNVSSSPDTAIVLRSGADSEMVSGFSREQTQIIADSPGVARNAKGPLSSAELFVIINLPKRSTGSDANVPLRGVESAATDVRDNLKIVQGRMFELGKDEVIVGVGAAQEFSGLKVGSKIKVGRYEWPVVGMFSANGAVCESEIWTDAKVLQAAYNPHPPRLTRSLPSLQRLPYLQPPTHRGCVAPVRLLRQAIRDHDPTHHHSRILRRHSHGRRRDLRRFEHHVQRRRRADP